MVKKLAIVAFAVNGLAAHAAGLQADHVVTHIEGDRERVEVGRWIHDEAGRTRFDIDDWTQITDPMEGLVWRANSKRGKYSKRRIRLPTHPMGTPLIDLPGSLDGPNSREISRTDLGTRVVSGVECEGTVVEIVVSGGGFAQSVEFEAWMTEAFIFPFNVMFTSRSDGGEQRTELRNIVELTDTQMEGIFRPDDDWKESRFPLARTGVSWTGFWPFTRPGSRVTGTVLPLPQPREARDW